ncbi:MAG: hypothetical protein ACRDHU_05645 [Actinomycetota bacterium]
MDDVATLEPESRRADHRAAVIAYAEARDALAEAGAAFVRAADRAREAREALWEKAWGLLARGGDPGPMPELLAHTDEGKVLIREAKARLRALL